MNKTFYFMAGLPRAGSTVLSSILNQNPRFHAGPSSPVLSVMQTLENHFRKDELFYGYPKPEQARQIIFSIPFQFYSDIEKPVVFDKNRGWPWRIPLIEMFTGQTARIICPVRSTAEVLASMIRMVHRNPQAKEGEPLNFIDDQLVKLNIPLSDDARCEQIAGPQGILGQSVSAIVDAFQQGMGDRIHLVEYHDLVGRPEETLQAIYRFLGEEYYPHSFNSLSNRHRERDSETYGFADMHEVHSQLKAVAPHPKEVLSESILKRCEGMDAWRSRLNETT